MKRPHVLFAVAWLLAGCVSPGVTPPSEAIANLKAVHIVAMESHPLGFIPDLKGTSEEVDQRAKELSRTYQAALDRGGWVPTVVLAKEAQARLAERGLQATIAPRVKPIPGVEHRDYTLTLENWLAPTRAWYNDAEPAAGYADLPRDPSSYVLEVAVINYEIASFGRLLLQVAMKLIDPSTGNVVGRARAWNAMNSPRLEPVDQALSGDAARFKEAFLGTGRELTTRCLAELGFIPGTR
jgi:hypothetical protein